MDSQISALLGKTITVISGLEKDSKEARFQTSDGKCYIMDHSQDCCEIVAIADVVGDVHDLVGTPILRAEERKSSNLDPPAVHHDESWTWTFYELATIKGAVTIRWLGESNGYYSESVDFSEVPQP